MSASTKRKVSVEPRGAIKAFREYLNAKFADSANWRNGAYHQRTRGYGDYLYHQDRFKFDVELQDALFGATEYEGFKFHAYSKEAK